MSKKISNLTPVNSLSATDLLYLSRPLSGSTYTSNSITYQNILNALDDTFGLKSTTDSLELSAISWNNTYTTVQTNSATWGTGGVDLTQYTPLSTYQSTSGVYTTVQTNSATWSTGGVDLTQYTPLSTYQSTSGVYTTVQTNSATWESAVQPNTDVSFNNISATSLNLTTTLTITGAYSADGLLPIIINGQVRYLQLLV